MVNTIQLHLLRPGDLLQYHGIRWQVTDYSTYQDPNGYKTEEWLLQSKEGQEYYLLREFDPENSANTIHWYLAKEISNPQLFLPNTISVKANHLWQDMNRQSAPYPELKLLRQTYYFESQTQGKYKEKRDNSSRITWDYWDKIHRNNLAIEAWKNGELYVYLSQIVESEDFSQIEKGEKKRSVLFPIRELIAALAFLLVGLLLLIFG